MTEVNKVIYDGNVLIDLTSDTVTEKDVMGGATFHLPDGTIGVGALSNETLGNGYGTCSTSSTTTGSTRVVSLADYKLVKGGIIAVKFTYAVPSGSYLNVNSKGAKRIYHEGATLKAGVIGAGDTAFFMYDGSYYRLLGVDACVITKDELTSLETALGL